MFALQKNVCINQIRLRCRKNVCANLQPNFVAKNRKTKRCSLLLFDARFFTSGLKLEATSKIRQS